MKPARSNSPSAAEITAVASLGTTGPAGTSHHHHNHAAAYDSDDVNDHALPVPVTSAQGSGHVPISHLGPMQETMDVNVGSIAQLDKKEALEVLGDVQARAEAVLQEMRKARTCGKPRSIARVNAVRFCSKAWRKAIGT